MIFESLQKNAKMRDQENCVIGMIFLKYPNTARIRDLDTTLTKEVKLNIFGHF